MVQGRKRQKTRSVKKKSSPKQISKRLDQLEHKTALMLIAAGARILNWSVAFPEGAKSSRVNHLILGDAKGINKSVSALGGGYYIGTLKDK